jgi:hypothetical protein
LRVKVPGLKGTAAMTDLPSHRDHEGAIETGFPQTPPVVIVHAVTEFIGNIR